MLMSACDPENEAVWAAEPSSVANPTIKTSRVRNESVFRGAAVRVRARTLPKRIGKVSAICLASTEAQTNLCNRISAESIAASSLELSDALPRVNFRATAMMAGFLAFFLPRSGSLKRNSGLPQNEPVRSQLELFVQLCDVHAVGFERDAL